VATYARFIEAYDDTADADSAYYRKGHIEMINLQRYADALATFTALVNRYPDTMVRAEAYYGLARTHYLMGNRERARATLDYLLEKYGDTYAAEEARKIRQRF
jgi:TolA-binding protein